MGKGLQTEESHEKRPFLAEFRSTGMLTSRLVDINGRFGIKNHLNLQGRCHKSVLSGRNLQFRRNVLPEVFSIEK
jgi:hypothetical protein